MYLAVIIDWYSRAVLSWKLSNTMDVYNVLEKLDSKTKTYFPIILSYKGKV